MEHELDAPSARPDRAAHRRPAGTGGTRRSFPDEADDAVRQPFMPVIEGQHVAGGMLFEAHAVLAAPAGADEGELRAAMESLADELMVDVALAEDA